jgi:hypothetical protein
MPKVIQNCFAKCGFSAASSAEVDDKDKNCTWVEQQDHADCTSTFTSFVILTNLSQPLAIGQLVCSPSPQLCACDTGKEEEMVVETQPLPTQSSRKDALMVLRVLDLVE